MIPRTLHRIWVGGHEPAWLSELGETWRRHHPDWAIMQWNDDHVPDDLVNQDLYDRAEELAPDHVGQFRADVLRYELLWRYGGVYVDADFEALRPLDDLLDGVDAFAAWQDDRFVNNAILGASAEHPLMRSLVDGLPDSVARHRGAPPRKVSGPHYLTAAVRGRSDVTLFDRELFYPYDWRALHHRPGETFAGAYAVHLWFNQRRERGLLDADGELS